MMRKLLLALGLTLGLLAPAYAQNTTCSDRPSTDVSNACANTRFVHGAVAGIPGTSPGGTDGQVQYNNSGAFGGFTMSGSCTIVTSTGVITCSAFPISTATSISSTGAYDFVVPAGKTTVRIDGNGAGGGGGGASAGTPGGAASAGAGGAHCGLTLAVSPGDHITGVVGTGGAFGTDAFDGAAGTATTFIYSGVTHTAGGGTGGHSAAAGVAQSSVAGGTITNCDSLSGAGQVSSQGIFSYNGSASVANGGTGGSSPNGGFGGNGGAANGNAGDAAGGGGGGGGGNGGSIANGGVGGNGRMVFQY